MRVKLTIAYNGTHFLGSQTQTQTNNTVLGQLQKALKQLGISQKVVASGRTDKAVHATGQVCHVDVPEFWDDSAKLKRVLNEMLPTTISIRRSEFVDDTFHARYSAQKRCYRYIIKESSSNPFEADFITFLQQVDFEKIAHNIQLFQGKHDFSSFMKTGSDMQSSIREVYQAFAYRYKSYIILNFQANGFLRSQIRLMVSALLALNATEIELKLANKYISKKTKPAPANGLYLARINY